MMLQLQFNDRVALSSCNRPTSALLLFEKEINRIATYQGLKSIASKASLECLIEEHTNKIGFEIGLTTRSNTYSLSMEAKRGGRELCNEVTIGEAYGVVQRRIEEFDSHRPAHKFMDVKNGLDKLCGTASSSINRGNSKFILGYSIYESGGPGVYEVDFFQYINDPSGKKCKVGGYGFNPRTINDLMTIINKEISDPHDLIKVINQNIEAQRSKWRPKQDFHKLW